MPLPSNMTESVQLRYVKRIGQHAPSVVEIEPEVLPQGHPSGGINPSVLDENDTIHPNGHHDNTAFIRDDNNVATVLSNNPEVS